MPFLQHFVEIYFGSAFRSTALTRTSAGDAATGTSGGGAGCWRLRKATTTATAAANSSAAL